MNYSVHNFSHEAGVSAEVLQDFKDWQALLTRWNAKINLVSQSALADYWLRHALDSWQLTAHVPVSAARFLDLGSGGGFPGLALAIYCKHKGEGEVTLVESVGKKANFLRTVIRELSLPATVKAERIESLEPQIYDLISARAFAPLPKLLDYCAPFWGPETLGIFLKGQSASQEITAAQAKWAFQHRTFPSKTDPEGVILTLSDLLLNN